MLCERHLEISSPLSMNEGVEKLPVDMWVSECTRPSPRMLQDSSASKKSSWFMATARPPLVLLSLICSVYS